MSNLAENKPTKQILILKEPIRLVRVSTTSNEEEDFLLITELTDAEIQAVVTPIVEKERNEEQAEEYFYDNEGLLWALKDHYPRCLVIQYTNDSMDSLTI